MFCLEDWNNKVPHWILWDYFFSVLCICLVVLGGKVDSFLGGLVFWGWLFGVCLKYFWLFWELGVLPKGYLNKKTWGYESVFFDLHAETAHANGVMLLQGGAFTSAKHVTLCNFFVTKSVGICLFKKEFVAAAKLLVTLEWTTEVIQTLDGS